MADNAIKLNDGIQVGDVVLLCGLIARRAGLVVTALSAVNDPLACLMRLKGVEELYKRLRRVGQS
jgi:hypothetical protein